MDSGPEHIQTRSATVCQKGEAMSQFTHLESPMTIRGKVYRNRLIAADITSAQTDGFVHGLLDMPQT